MTGPGNWLGLALEPRRGQEAFHKRFGRGFGDHARPMFVRLGLAQRVGLDGFAHVQGTS